MLARTIVKNDIPLGLDRFSVLAFCSWIQVETRDLVFQLESSATKNLAICLGSASEKIQNYILGSTGLRAHEILEILS
jgi:hypothetical protein